MCCNYKQVLYLGERSLKVDEPAPSRWSFTPLLTQLATLGKIPHTLKLSSSSSLCMKSYHIVLNGTVFFKR